MYEIPVIFEQLIRNYCSDVNWVWTSDTQCYLPLSFILVVFRPCKYKTYIYQLQALHVYGSRCAHTWWWLSYVTHTTFYSYLFNWISFTFYTYIYKNGFSCSLRKCVRPFVNVVSNIHFGFIFFLKFYLFA